MRPLLVRWLLGLAWAASASGCDAPPPVSPPDPVAPPLTGTLAEDAPDADPGIAWAPPDYVQSVVCGAPSADGTSRVRVELVDGRPLARVQVAIVRSGTSALELCRQGDPATFPAPEVPGPFGLYLFDPWGLVPTGRVVDPWVPSETIVRLGFTEIQGTVTGARGSALGGIDVEILDAQAAGTVATSSTSGRFHALVRPRPPFELRTRVKWPSGSFQGKDAVAVAPDATRSVALVVDVGGELTVRLRSRATVRTEVTVGDQATRLVFVNEEERLTWWGLPPGNQCRVTVSRWDHDPTVVDATPDGRTVGFLLD